MSTGDNHNRLRQLKGLVSLDPWHENNPRTGRVDLYAYVSFDEARLGGEQQDEIAFRLHLRRAEIKLLQSEPKSYEIDPGRIWRGDQDRTGMMTRKVETEAGSDRKRAMNGGISEKGLEAAASAEFSRRDHRRESTEYVLPHSEKTIIVSFQRNDRGQPTWRLRPSSEAPCEDGFPVLNGQAWDDKTQLLLSMRADQKLAEQEMLSSIRMCLICKREDIVFHDLQVRGADGEFNEIPDWSPKKVVVQEYLKSSLIREGLHAADMDSPFSIITLGEAISEHRRDGDA